MKKVASLLLAVVLMLSISVSAYADGTINLTTTVPGASYTLTIPEDVEIKYNATSTDIGTIAVKDATGFAVGKDVHVTVSSPEKLISTTTDTDIPFRIFAIYTYNTSTNEKRTISQFNPIVFRGSNSGGVYGPYVHANSTDYKLLSFQISINSSAWGAAKSGQYSSTVTFTSEIVSA